MEDTLEIIDKSTADLPPRWRQVLKGALLPGNFRNEADRLLRSSLAIHQRHSPEMEIAESILAGDTYIPMAVEVLLEHGVSLDEIRNLLSEAAARLPE